MNASNIERINTFATVFFNDYYSLQPLMVLGLEGK
jgi:hypothetical protein